MNTRQNTLKQAEMFTFAKIMRHLFRQLQTSTIVTIKATE